MKPLLLAVILLVGPLLRAESFIVYAKGAVTQLDAGAKLPKPADPGRAAFLSAFEADLAQPQAFPPPIPLADFPQYGRNVAGAGGQIQFHESFPGGFVVKVALHGLPTSHRFILTLNGNPERAGNNQLPETVPGNAREKYFDFQTITTDGAGRFEATYAVALPAGPYDLRFYVKDTADFKIVLYHDFFRFTVR
jgi:hypothetical protein